MGLQPNAVVVSTHLDDAVLSCYGALGPATTVVTVLAGVPPPGVLGSWDAEGGATSSRERVLQRQAEDRRALLRSQATPVHLDFPDGQQWGQPGLAEPTLDELATGLEPHVAAAGRVYAPAGIHNPEHKLIRDAVLAVRADATLYADLPYALHPSLGFTLPADVSPAGRLPRPMQLDEATAAEKVEAARCYESQLTQLVANFGPFLTPEKLGRELLWERL